MIAESGDGGLGGGGAENLGRLPLLFLLHASNLESGFDDDDDDGYFLEDPDSDCFAFLLPAFKWSVLFLIPNGFFYLLLSLLLPSAIAAAATTLKPVASVAAAFAASDSAASSASP